MAKRAKRAPLESGNDAGEPSSIVDPAALAPGDGGDGEQLATDADPGDGAGDSEPVGEQPRRRAGRPRGTRNPKKAVPIDLGNFGEVLYSTHAMLAALSSVQEINLERSEADQLAVKIGNVARHYNISGFSQQTLDWIMLIQTAGAIYGMRIMAYRIRKASERPKASVPVAVASSDTMRPAPHMANGAQKPAGVQNGPKFAEVMTPEGPARVPIG